MCREKNNVLDYASEADLYGNVRQSGENAFKENGEDSDSAESMNNFNESQNRDWLYDKNQTKGLIHSKAEAEDKADIYTTDSLQDLKQQLKELLDENDYKGVRKLLRRNDNCNNLKSRELNEDLNVGSHRFVMRNGRMTFIPITQSESLTSKPDKEQESSMPFPKQNSQNNSIIQEIIDVVNPHSIILQQIIDYLHEKDPYFTIQ